MSFNWTYGRALAAAVFIMLVMLTKNVVDQYDDLVSANLPNPDSYYKLVLIKDYDPAHGFQFIARDNAPEGSWVHWSMPHTWTIMQLQKGVMLLGVDSDKALLLAGGGLTILCMLLLATFVAMTVLNIGSNLAAVLSALALATSFPLFGYGQLVQITHHIFMLVPIAAACILFFRRDMQTRQVFDWLGGIFLGLALWISPETMPFVLTVAATRGALQLQQASPTYLWPAATGFLMMLFLGWTIDPPPPTFQPWALDHISLTWLLFGALMASVMLVVDLCSYYKVRFAISLVVTVAAFILCVALWVLIVPAVILGPLGLLPEELHPLWWSKIKELQSVNTVAEWVGYLAPPLFAGLWLTFIAWKEQKLWMLILALATLVYGVLAASYIRMGAASAVMAALAFGLCASRLRVLRSLDNSACYPLSEQLFGVLIILFFPLYVFLVTAIDDSAVKEKSLSPCQFNSIVDDLGKLPIGTVMLPLNFAPELLYKTYHSTIAGNYHHNVDGLLDITKFFYDMNEVAAINLVGRRRVSYIVFCHRNVVSAKSSSFIMALSKKNNTQWLVDLGLSDNGWHVMRVNE